MSELKKHIVENGIPYTLVGDYYFPFYDVPDEEPYQMKRWAYLHMRYLQEAHPVRYNEIVMSGEWDSYFRTLDEQADARFETLMTQMKQAEGITEALKRTDQMEWVGRMNNLRNRIEEIICAEMIYV